MGAENRTCHFEAFHGGSLVVKLIPAMQAYRKHREPAVYKLKEPVIDEITHSLAARYGLNFTMNDTSTLWFLCKQGLTVLEYLVANGSERVIEEIKEHSYQITSLSDFQYPDHTGWDQGSNVRKKSQSLVALVNDKEKLQEVREKAAANWDKFHNTSGGMKQRPGSYPGAGGNGDEGRYGSRDEDHNGYGRERDYSYGNKRSGRGRYRDDEYRGRRSVDGDNYGRRSRSSDRDRQRTGLSR